MTDSEVLVVQLLGVMICVTVFEPNSTRFWFIFTNMGTYEKLILKILTGRSDRDFRFSELCKLLDKLGFELRIKGSHHIFFHNDVEEIVNIQSKGGFAKAYQVKQIREIIVKYKLSIDEI